MVPANVIDFHGLAGLLLAMDENQHYWLYTSLPMSVILPLPAKFPPEPSLNALDLRHAFSPPVCCYRGEKKGVVYKECADRERDLS